MTGALASPPAPVTGERIIAPGVRISGVAPEFEAVAVAIGDEAYALGIVWGWEQGAKAQAAALGTALEDLDTYLASRGRSLGPVGGATEGPEIIAAAIREAIVTLREPAAPTRSIKSVIRDDTGRIVEIIEEKAPQ